MLLCQAAAIRARTGDDRVPMKTILISGNAIRNIRNIYEVPFDLTGQNQWNQVRYRRHDVRYSEKVSASHPIDPSQIRFSPTKHRKQGA